MKPSATKTHFFALWSFGNAIHKENKVNVPLDWHIVKHVT